jgi:hypothetical protein
MDRDRATTLFLCSPVVKLDQGHDCAGWVQDRFSKSTAPLSLAAVPLLVGFGIELITKDEFCDQSGAERVVSTLSRRGSGRTASQFDHPGDHATFNSNHFPDGTTHLKQVFSRLPRILICLGDRIGDSCVDIGSKESVSVSRDLTKCLVTYSCEVFRLGHDQNLPNSIGAYHARPPSYR